MGQGTLLAGRYRLEERIRADPDGALWRGRDESLRRRVVARWIPHASPVRAAVLDAARRAAAVPDPRLVRVLDIGDGQSGAYVVSEEAPGRSLGAVLRDGPVPAETVRRLVGEAAEALDRAAGRGLRHLRLGPGSLVVGPDGGVVVVGAGTAAALAGVDPADVDDPGRSDAVGLVRLLYTGLTGRWPGPSGSGLDAAPRVGGVPVPPCDLVPGVATDLDQLCRATLGDGRGPRDPAGVVARLAPWAARSPLTSPGGLLIVPPGRPDPEAPAPRRWDAGPVVTGAIVLSTVPAAPDDTMVVGPSVVDTMDVRGALLRLADPPPPNATPPGGAVPVFRVPEEPEPAGKGESDEVPSGTDDTGDVPVAEEGPALRRPDAGDTDAPGAAWPAWPADAGSSEMVSSQDGRPRYDTAGAGSSNTDSWTLFGETGTIAEPVGPYLPEAPLARPPREQTRLVIIIVAAVLVVGLVAAVLSLLQLGSASPLVTDEGTASAAAAGTAAADDDLAVTTVSPSPTVAAAATTAARITGVQVLDPLGDGEENDEDLDAATDGDEATSWSSDTYGTAGFGGLKDGLGLLLTLDGAAAVSAVTLAAPGEDGTVELRAVDGDEVSDEVLASADLSGDGAELEVPDGTELPDEVALWFTAVPQQADGDLRVVVDEISVR